MPVRASGWLDVIGGGVVGDLDGNGELDIIPAPGPGGPAIVKVFRAGDGGLIGHNLRILSGKTAIKKTPKT